MGTLPGSCGSRGQHQNGPFQAIRCMNCHDNLILSPNLTIDVSRETYKKMNEKSKESIDWMLSPRSSKNKIYRISHKIYAVYSRSPFFLHYERIRILVLQTEQNVTCPLQPETRSTNDECKSRHTFCTPCTERSKLDISDAIYRQSVVA